MILARKSSARDRIDVTAIAVSFLPSKKKKKKQRKKRNKRKKARRAD
jgi:hypothetical protein